MSLFIRDKKVIIFEFESLIFIFCIGLLLYRVFLWFILFWSLWSLKIKRILISSQTSCCIDQKISMLCIYVGFRFNQNLCFRNSIMINYLLLSNNKVVLFNGSSSDLNSSSDYRFILSFWINRHGFATSIICYDSGLILSN